MAENVSPSDRRHVLSAESLADHGAGFPFGEAVRDANVYWVRTVEMKPGNLPKHSFKLMVGLDEPERLSGLERDAFTRAYFATLKFREGILTIGQDGEPTLQRNTSITLKAAGVSTKAATGVPRLELVDRAAPAGRSVKANQYNSARNQYISAREGWVAAPHATRLGVFIYS